MSTGTSADRRSDAARPTVNHSLTARKVAYLTDARYDGFLPTVWLALGMGEPRYDFKNARAPGLEPAGIHIASGNEPRLKQDEGMFFACSEFVPNPVVQALADEARTRKDSRLSRPTFHRLARR